MKTIKSLCIMKYVCTIIIYKENKLLNVSYNVKKQLWKDVYSMQLETPKITFLASDTETGNFENHVQNSSNHEVVANKLRPKDIGVVEFWKKKLVWKR